MSLRVVNLGLPKSGTTTLARALRSAGLRTADHRIRPHQTDDSDLHHAFVGDLVYRGYYHSGDPGALLQGFDAISEMSCLSDDQSLWPQTDFGVIEALRRCHPGVKFVSTWRDPFEMSQSILAWSDLGTSRLPSQSVPGLPPGYGETTKERQTWIETHYRFIRRLFRGDPQFLEIDVSAPDAPDQLSEHLGLDIRWWGRANRNKLRVA